MTSTERLQQNRLPEPLLDNLPAPTAELFLIGIILRAHVKTLGRKKRAKFLEELDTTMAEFLRHQAVIDIRPVRDQLVARHARTQGATWWQAVRALVAGMDGK